MPCRGTLLQPLGLHNLPSGYRGCVGHGSVFAAFTACCSGEAGGGPVDESWKVSVLSHYCKCSWFVSELHEHMLYVSVDEELRENLKLE